MSTHHWGESAKGDWKIRVRDRKKDRVGVVHELKLTLSGAAPAGALVAGSVLRHSTGEPIRSIAPGETLDADFEITNRGSTALTNLQIALVNTDKVAGSTSTTSIDSIAPGETKLVRASLQSLATIGANLQPTLQITAATDIRNAYHTTSLSARFRRRPSPAPRRSRFPHSPAGRAVEKPQFTPRQQPSKARRPAP
jgi:hypothetical protein